MKPINCIVGYPRSGNNWLAYSLAVITGQEFHYTHANHQSFWEEFATRKNNYIFMVRNYKEAIVRFRKTTDAGVIISNMTGVKPNSPKPDFTDYMTILKGYDECPAEQRFLVYYEDMLYASTFMDTLLKLLHFMDAPVDGLFEFMQKFDWHKQQSVARYSREIDQSQTHGTSAVYHSATLTSQARKSIDEYVKSQFPELQKKYLTLYA